MDVFVIVVLAVVVVDFVAVQIEGVYVEVEKMVFVEGVHVCVRVTVLAGCVEVV